MRNAKWMVTILAATVMGVLLFYSPGPVQAADPIKLNYSIFFPAPHKNTVLATEWAQEIEKRTNGAVKITMFPGGTLTPADKCYDGVVNGLSDIGMSVMGYTRGRFPLSEVIDLPLGYKNGLAATQLINLYYEKFKPKELDDVKVLYLHAHGPGILHTKKPVKNLDDLKGMKIVCHGLSAKVVGALGATPVAMPMPERYDALQKGVAEGGVNPIESLKGWKLARSDQVHHREFRLGVFHGFFRGHEQGQVGVPAAGYSKNDRSGQPGMDREDRQWLGRDGQGRPGVHLVQGKPDHSACQGRGRKMGQAGAAHPG